jgi:hypothetical protein
VRVDAPREPYGIEFSQEGVGPDEALKGQRANLAFIDAVKAIRDRLAVIVG